MNRFVMSLGSNSVDRHEQMAAAIDAVSSLLNVSRRSPVYETKPWGGGDNLYLNCVIAGETSMNFEQVNAFAKDWERQSGRDEAAKKAGIVPIDIDIVIWNDDVLRHKELERDYFMRGYRSIF